MRTQHGIERACARHAHVFTTVSPITAEECTALLGRTPDLITPNGLTISRFNVGHDLQRPECILAERDGTLWSADARGGVVKILPDGSQNIISQKRSGQNASAKRR